MENNQVPAWAQTIIDNQTAMVDIIKGLQTELAEVKAEKVKIEKENQPEAPPTEGELNEIWNQFPAF